MKDSDDGGRFLLQARSSAPFAQSESGVLQGLQHSEALVEVQYDIARDGIVRFAGAHSANLRRGCDTRVGAGRFRDTSDALLEHGLEQHAG